MQSMHGAKKKKATAKKAKRRGKKRTMKKAGRPKGSTSRFGLKAMSLERLSELIDAARVEARSRLALRHHCGLIVQIANALAITTGKKKAYMRMMRSPWNHERISWRV